MEANYSGHGKYLGLADELHCKYYSRPVARGVRGVRSNPPFQGAGSELLIKEATPRIQYMW